MCFTILWCKEKLNRVLPHRAKSIDSRVSKYSNISNVSKTSKNSKSSPFYGSFKSNHSSASPSLVSTHQTHGRGRKTTFFSPLPSSSLHPWQGRARRGRARKARIRSRWCVFLPSCFLTFFPLSPPLLLFPTTPSPFPLPSAQCSILLSYLLARSLLLLSPSPTCFFFPSSFFHPHRELILKAFMHSHSSLVTRRYLPLYLPFISFLFWALLSFIADITSHFDMLSAYQSHFSLASSLFSITYFRHI